MEKKETKFFKHKNKTQKQRVVEEEEEEIENLETISLADLQMNEGNESPRVSSSPQEFFEFFSESSDSENYSNTFSNIVFCGKTISNDNDIDERELQEEQLHENMLFRFNSFHRPAVGLMNQKRANSARFYNSPNSTSVNITGLTSMSAKSRKKMFMFGPVKFKPEMELSAIKQRQGRRSNSFNRPLIGPMNQKRANSAQFHSSPMNFTGPIVTGLTSMSARSRKRMSMLEPVKFKPEMELSAIKPRQGRCCTRLPAVVHGGDTTAIVKSGQKKNKGGPTGKFTELRWRPHFVNVLAKSLSCFSMRKHCMAALP